MDATPASCDLTGTRIAVLAFLNPLTAIASDALVYGTP